MKKEDFAKIIRLMSFWKIDKRKGNYRLPAGDLIDYVDDLIRKFCNNNNYVITKDLKVYEAINTNDKRIKKVIIPFGTDIEVNIFDMSDDIHKMAEYIVGC